MSSRVISESATDGLHSVMDDDGPSNGLFFVIIFVEVNQCLRYQEKNNSWLNIEMKCSRKSLTLLFYLLKSV